MNIFANTLCLILLFGLSIRSVSMNQFHRNEINKGILQEYTFCPLKIFKNKRKSDYTKASEPHSICVGTDSALNICQKLIDDKWLMTIERQNKIIIEWEDSAIGTAWEGTFDVLVGDLDGNKLDELIIAELQGESNGFGRAYWKMFIIKDFDPNNPAQPIELEANVYGPKGTFIRKINSKKCNVLAAKWISLNHPERGWGTYLEAVLFDYNKGFLSAIPDKPRLIRRYLFSFEKERGRTWDSPLLPLIWLKNVNVESVTEEFIRQHSK